MIITHKIKMDMARPWIMPAVEVMQDDKYSRNIEFTLTQNGTDLQIPEGTTAIVRFCKPDGTGGNYDKLPDGTAAYTIIGNVVTIALAPQVCTASGKVLLTACLINDATELHTFSVRINVNRNPGLVTQSENYFKIAGSLADSGWEPNSLLETDGSGNVVAKKSSYVKTVNGVAPDENGNVAVEGGVSKTVADLLITILQNGVYSTNQSANITALDAALKASIG